MPNDPYLDASVAWRIRSGTMEFREASYRTNVEAILSAGMATEVEQLLSCGKEAEVYLARYKGSPLAVKVYRLYRTSHRGGRPVKLESAGRLAAHEFDMMLQGWKGGARVPTPAMRVENMLSMRYLGTEAGPAPRLQDVELDDPEGFASSLLEAVRGLALAGVVHTDLSPFNVLVHESNPWIIDLSEALRVDRTGYSPWQRLTLAKAALEKGVGALASHFSRYEVDIEVGGFVTGVMSSLDRFGVMR
ncbi:MAG: hypothetical protein MUE65_03035 [Methanomassiliicoccales archaeon]|jgi:serine/threonine-protein kinase RIO1|nr:hypothetical protein [Methanomassiliicoccales archaeon]